MFIIGLYDQGPTKLETLNFFPSADDQALYYNLTNFDRCRVRNKIIT